MGLFAQINTNNFVYFNSIELNNNFSNIFLVDIDVDGIEEVVLIDLKSHSIVFYDIADNKYFYKGRIGISDRIDFLTPLFRQQYHFYFLYIDKKNLVVGLITINKELKYNFTSGIKINSFPKYVNKADLDSDGKVEIILSGNNYRGISIIDTEKLKLTINTFDEAESFTDVKSSDLDYDGIQDLIAYNPSRNSFALIYNNGFNSYKTERFIPALGLPSQFLVYDYNGDFFDDIIYNSSKIVISYGDSVSSFLSKEIIYKNENIEKFYLEDLNGNSKPDLISLEKNETGFKIFFDTGKNINSEQEINYFKEYKFSQILLFRKGNLRSLYGLTDKRIFTLSSKFSSVNDMKISFGFIPESITEIDINNDNINDALILQRNSKNVYFLQSSINKYQLYRFKRKTNSQIIKISKDILGNTISIYFDYGNHFFEVVKPDFITGNQTSSVQYTPSPLFDICIENNSSNILPSVKVLLNQNNNLIIEQYDFKNNYYQKKYSVLIDTNVTDAYISDYLTPIVYYIGKDDSFYVIRKHEIDKSENLVLQKFNIAPIFLKNQSESIRNKLLFYFYDNNYYFFYNNENRLLNELKNVKISDFYNDFYLSNHSERTFLSIKTEEKNKLINFEILNDKYLIPNNIIDTFAVNKYITTLFRNKIIYLIGTTNDNYLVVKKINEL